MNPFNIKKLRSTLQFNFEWNKKRLKFLTDFVTLKILIASLTAEMDIPLVPPEIIYQSNYYKRFCIICLYS